MDHENFQRLQALDSETSLGEKTLDQLRAGVRDAAAWHDELVLSAATKAPLACKAGCSSCCWLPASASFAELAHLAATLIETLSPEDFEALTARLSEAASDEAGPARAGDRGQRRACALLVDGLCSAHEARPLACRGWNSRKVEPCLLAFAEPDVPPSIPVDARVHGTARAIAEGMREGARRLELDDSVLDLRATLRVLLEDVAGWTQRWFDGERLPTAFHGERELSVALGEDGRWRTRAIQD